MNTFAKSRHTLILLLLAGAVIYMVGLGWERRDAEAETASKYVAAAQRKSAGKLDATDLLTGKPWSLDNYRGKVILINYFATWCPPCRAETPDLVHAAQTYGPRGLVVVGVNREGTDLPATKTAVNGFAREYQVPFPLVRNDQVEVPFPDPFGGGMGLPTSVFVDKQGRIASVHQGALSTKMIAAETERLLGEPAGENEK